MDDQRKELIKEWDKKYYIHTFANEKTYKPILVERTEGNYIYTSDGKKYLDFASQLVSVNLGNSNFEINERINDALVRYGFLWDKYLTEYRALAAKKIIEDIPGVSSWAGKVKFFNSGSETVEAAVSLARLIKKKEKILIKDYDFHGWTSEALKCTRIKHFGSLKDLGTNEISELQGDGNYVAIPSPFCARCKFGKSYPECKENDILYCIKQTEKLIDKIGAPTIAAYLGETVSGFGMVIPPVEYMPQLKTLLDQHEILWINDEILTGFGRLGKWFAYDLYDRLYPDIMCIGKGMVNSIIPCGAIVVSKEIARILEDKVWYLGSTFSGNPPAMAAAVAAIDYMIKNGIVKEVEEKGYYLQAKLYDLISKYESDFIVSGYGLFWQMEFIRYQGETRSINVNNRYSPAQRVMNECFKNGLVLGGLLPYSLRLAPSFTITRREMDWAIEVLSKVLNEFFDERK